MTSCINDWCSRPAHYSDGRCKPCWLREVWRPERGDLYAAHDRERVRRLAAERRERGREHRATRPQFFTPPS